MSFRVYDPTSNCMLDNPYEVVDESGLILVKSPRTDQWFVLDRWTGDSRLIDSLSTEERATVDETLRIESVGSDLHESEASVAEPRRAAGGVVIDSQSRILLRAPYRAYGGYVWTFPKGRVDPGETMPMAALREVEEETGWRCRIEERIGDYRGDTSETRFYLMRPLEKAGEPDGETEEVVWARPERAVQLLSKTVTPRGRRRDITVLRDALAAHDVKFGTELSSRVYWAIGRSLGDEPVEAARPPVRVILPSHLTITAPRAD